MRPAVNNTWAILGGGVVTVLFIVLQALAKFFDSGRPWPTTLSGWLAILLPALVLGLIAALTPHYSRTEALTGNRISDANRGDTPVLRIPPGGLLHLEGRAALVVNHAGRIVHAGEPPLATRDDAEAPHGQ